MTVETYRHSGGIGALGIPLMCLGGGLTTVTLGVAYAYALAWIPFVYVSFLLTAGFGALVGLVVGICAKLGKVRNPLVAGIIGVFCAILGLYVAWAFDALARFGSDEIPGPMFAPDLLVEYIKYFYEEGFWGIGRANATVSGMFLAAIWAAEAIVLIGLAWLFSSGFISTHPFCENCQTWTNQSEGIAKINPPHGDVSVIEQLCDGQIDAISKFKLCDPEAADYIRIDTAICPTCTESNFVSVYVVETTQDKDGNNKVESKPLKQNMIVSSEETQRLSSILEELSAT